MNKRDLVKLLKGEIGRELETLRRAALSAREAATHEENRPENDKDTRAIEAAYLAGAQADRAREIERVMNALEFLPLRAFAEGDPILASALIEVDIEGKRASYFLAPHGGGLRVEVEGAVVQVITPQSPMGQALLGKTVGDVAQVKTEGRIREVEVLAVR